MSVVLVRCRARKERTNERKSTREPLETSRRDSGKEKEIAKKLFPTQIHHHQSAIFLRETKQRNLLTTTTTHFSCSIFASCNLTTAFVQCDPQSMPYFSCSIALFFVLDASTKVVPSKERRTRDTATKIVRERLITFGDFEREKDDIAFSRTLMVMLVRFLSSALVSRSKSARFVGRRRFVHKRACIVFSGGGLDRRCNPIF